MEHNKLRAPYHSEEVENKWEISYGDMITLLLGFFVLFFNIKTETMNIQLIQKDITNHFDFEKRQRAGRVVASLHGGEKDSAALSSLDENLAQRLKVVSNLENGKLLVEFPGISFYRSASFELTSEGQAVLSEFARAIKGHSGVFRLVIRGYTDTKPVRAGSRFKDNLELSAFRSISALRHLTSQGLDISNMRIAGFGESSDGLSNEQLDQLSQQRKVVIVVEPLDHTERSNRPNPNESKTGEIK